MHSGGEEESQERATVQSSSDSVWLACPNTSEFSGLIPMCLMVGEPRDATARLSLVTYVASANSAVIDNIPVVPVLQEENKCLVNLALKIRGISFMVTKDLSQT
jgi:hypothetical protein